MAYQKRELAGASAAKYESTVSRYLKPDGTLAAFGHLGHSTRILLRSALRRKGMVELAESISLPHKTRQDIEIPPDGDIRKLEKVATKMPAAEGASILFILKTGLRAKEFLSLPRAIVKTAVKTGVLRVMRKGSYSANVALSDTTKAYLKTLLTQPIRRAPESTLEWEYVYQLFTLRAGIDAAYSALRLAVRRATKQAGMVMQSPHWLRHVFATSLVRNGAPLSVVQRALGHLSPTTSMRYTHATPEEVLQYVR